MGIKNESSDGTKTGQDEDLAFFYAKEVFDGFNDLPGDVNLLRRSESENINVDYFMGDIADNEQIEEDHYVKRKIVVGNRGDSTSETQYQKQRKYTHNVSRTQSTLKRVEDFSNTKDIAKKQHKKIEKDILKIRTFMKMPAC